MTRVDVQRLLSLSRGKRYGYCFGVHERSHPLLRNVCGRFPRTGARRLAASAKSLVTVRRTETATGTHVTEIERGTGTETATVTTANGTGTEIMTVTVTVNGTKSETVNGTKNETAIVRRREPVAPGTTGMTMTHDGHRVTTDAIVNGIWRVTHRGIVVTETVIGMLHEDQVRERMTGNGVQEGTRRKTEKATKTLGRGERQKMMSEVRKWVAFSCRNRSLSFSNAVHRGQDTTQKLFQPRNERVAMKHRRRERYDT
jgi:hypothetical protein